MFDKIYRQTMDDVPLNYELLADLKRQAEQSDKLPVITLKKKPVFNVYRYGLVAAALVVAVLGTNIFSSYMKTKDILKTETENYIEADITMPSKSAETDTAVQKEKTADMVQDAGVYDAADEAVSSREVVNYRADVSLGQGVDTEKPTDTANAEYSSNQNTTAEINNEPIQNDVKKALAEPVVANAEESNQADAYAVAPAEETSDTADVSNAEVAAAKEGVAVAEETEQTPELAIAETENAPASGSSGGGGGSLSKVAYMSAAGEAHAASTSGYEQWSVEEYCDYFGFDISSIVLPDDMKNSTIANCGVYKEENGDIISAQGTVFYSTGDKTVTLTLYTDADYVKSVADINEKISSSVWIRRYDNGLFTVWAAFSNYGYIAEISGFSETEMTAFASSLK